MNEIAIINIITNKIKINNNSRCCICVTSNYINFVSCNFVLCSLNKDRKSDILFGNYSRRNLQLLYIPQQNMVEKI